MTAPLPHGQRMGEAPPRPGRCREGRTDRPGGRPKHNSKLVEGGGSNADDHVMLLYKSVELQFLLILKSDERSRLGIVGVHYF